MMFIRPGQVSACSGFLLFFLNRLAGDVFHRHALPEIGLVVRRGAVGCSAALGTLRRSALHRPLAAAQRGFLPRDASADFCHPTAPPHFDRFSPASPRTVALPRSPRRTLWSLPPSARPAAL